MFRFLALLALIPAAYANDHAIQSMSGWDAFSALQNGNMRFYEGKALHQHQDAVRRDELFTGQKPHTIVLSCSDSRVGPEVIFDQGLGDLFVIRVAGNVVGAEAIASVEYAIEHLGARLLLVMGHESCGAVKAAISSKPGVSNGSESLDVLVEHIRGHLTSLSLTSAATDSSLRQPVKENVSATLKEILRKSDIVTEAVRKKGLVLAQGVYSLKTGRVEFWDVGVKNQIVSAVGSAIDAPKIQEQSVHEEIIPDQVPPPAKKLKLKATAP
ncbi:MAG: carbonic anhydrase [Bacteriovoracia bacterium]